MKSDVLVLGGGIAGLGTALALVGRGHRVTVLDQNEQSRGASWAAAGIIAPCAESLLNDNHRPQFLDLALAGQSALEKFLAQVGWSDVLTTEGSLVCSWSVDETTELTGRAVRLQERGLGRFWSNAKIADYFRHTRAPHSVFECGSDRALLPRPLMARLRDYLEKRKVTFVTARVDDVVIGDGTVVGVRCSAGGAEKLFTSDHYVVCLASASALVPGFALPADAVMPVRGQLIEYDIPSDYRHVIFAAGGYLVPRAASTLVGSTHERVGYDATTTVEAGELLRNRAAHLWPALKPVVPVAHWAGLRPATADGLPVVGKTQLAQLTVNAGHYRNGLVFTILCGELVAATIAGETIANSYQALDSRRLWPQ